MRRTFFFGIFLFVMFLHNMYNGRVLAFSFVSNDSFEQEKTGWSANNSNVEFEINQDAHEGTRSAQLLNNSSTSYGIEQSISHILPDSLYRLKGFVKSGNPPATKMFLRLAWYSSPDSTGSQIKTDDSPILTAAEEWTPLEITVTAPSQAHSAKIRLLAGSGRVYFDTISFIETQFSPTPASTNTPAPHSTPSIILSPIQTEYDNIVISEIFPYPESGQNEWFELYNPNNFDVQIYDWYIDDIENAGASPKKFTLFIPASGYGYSEVTSMFNNDTDQVRLLNSSKVEIDMYSYDHAEKNYSWGRTDEGTYCLQKPTQEKPNTSCAAHEETVTTPTSSLNRITSSQSNNSKMIRQSVVPTPQRIYKRYAVQPEYAGPLTEAEVLGDYIHINPKEETNTIPALSLASIGYSLLSIGSILMKMYRYSATL